MTSPAAPTPPQDGAPNKGFDITAWLNAQEPTWTSWAVGAGLGVLCVLFGLRGLYAFWRGEPPNKDKGIPAPPLSLGLLVFGGWVILSFGVSGFPK